MNILFKKHLIYKTIIGIQQQSKLDFWDENGIRFFTKQFLKRFTS